MTTPANAQAVTPLTILLVDDSPETGQLAGMFLKNFPYRLDLAGSGPAAIQRCRTSRYDLVFLDLQMPGMDGYATTEAIRAWEDAQGLPRMPILALTADILNTARERSLRAGCTGFIGKPFSQATLLQAIRQYAIPLAAQPDSGSAAGAAPPIQPSDGPEWDHLREKFLRNRRRDLDVLSSAVAANDWAAIHTIGHRMSGLAGSYGFEEIGAIGRGLEEAAGAQQPERVAAEIRQLSQMLERLDPSQDRAA